MAQAPKRSSPAAKPSDRYYQDLRQLARLARSESVIIDRRRDGSIRFTPYNSLGDSTRPAGNRQAGLEKIRSTTRDANEQHHEPMDTVDNVRSPKTSKKQQRDALRLQEFQEAKRAPESQSAARWLLLAQRQLWAARKATCNAVWTAWARSRTPEARRATRLKLRGLLWRAWTRPQIEPPPLSSPPGCHAIPVGLQVLGARSLRDEYILTRARAFTHHVRGGSRALWRWLGFRREIDFNLIHVGDARSPEAAGLVTPASNRHRNKKSRGGKKS